MSNLIHVSNFGKNSMIYSNEFGYMPSLECTKSEFKISKDLAKFIAKCGGWKVFKNLANDEMEEAKANIKATLG
jgi:hypothetical protein